MPPFNLILPIIAVFCGTAVLLTAMRLISQHLAQRHLSSSSATNDEVLRRLERIEQIVDATAVEMERLSETNRFVAKLLAEKTGTPPG
jgi:hypothetical protein